MGGWELLLLLVVLGVPATVLALVVRGKRRSERFSNGPRQAPSPRSPGYYQFGYAPQAASPYQQPAQQWQQPYWQASQQNGPFPPSRQY